MNFNALYPKFPFTLPMILDGATGTALIKSGMPAGVCPEKWILEHPETIKAIQKNYAEAGSDAVLAPTFGANRAILSRYALAGKTEEINRTLAGFSREAVGKKLIGGDLSPTGKNLFPIGDMTLDELIDIYAEQAKALEDTVDFYMIETQMDLACARGAVLGVRSISDKPIFVTMTVAANGKTMFGDDIRCAFLTLAELGIQAFGLNCSTGPQEMAKLLMPLYPLSVSLGIPLIAKPNAGAPKADGTHENLSPEVFADICKQMLMGGIPILGGCCGTDDTVIAALRKMVNANENACVSVPDAREETSLYAANSRQMIVIDPEELPEALIVDDDLSDNADEMADDCDYIYLRIETEEDVDTVLESAAFFNAPLVVCGNEDAIALLKKFYCGKLAVIRDNA